MGRLISLLLMSLAAQEKDREQRPPPLTFGPDFVEVTAKNTLGRRYRVWGDWDRNVAAYLADARALAAARGTPARKIVVGCVFLKDARITSTTAKGGDGQPLTAAYTTSPEFVEAMKTRGMKEYSEFMFAFSGGEVEVEWVVATAEGLHWRTEGTGWGCQPRAVGEQVLKALEAHKDAGICMWMFCAGRPTTLNPDPRDRKLVIGAPPYGISYTQWPLYGGYSLVLSAPHVGLMVHEFNHRYLDNLQAIEGINLTMFHGLSKLGYGDNDCGYPHLLNTYSSVYRYLIRRDMWRRFSLVAARPPPREPFSGRTYAWAEAAPDCWFRLPELRDRELAELTGLKTFRMDAPLKGTYRLYTVAAEERGRIRSDYVGEPSETDVRLNNLLSLNCESCAVLVTDTGRWLFVRPDLADVYVDMARLSGRPGGPLPTVGFVLEGVRPLIVLRGPSDTPLPPHELGFFTSTPPRAEERK